MSTESALFDHITGDANVTAVIGMRMYPLTVPDNAELPAIAYQEIDGVGERTLSGHFIYTARRYQLRLVADSYETIVQLKAAVNGTGDETYLITEGPDGFEFETQRYEAILEAQVSV